MPGRHISGNYSIRTYYGIIADSNWPNYDSAGTDLNSVADLRGMRIATSTIADGHALTDHAIVPYLGKGVYNDATKVFDFKSATHLYAFRQRDARYQFDKLPPNSVDYVPQLPYNRYITSQSRVGKAVACECPETLGENAFTVCSQIFMYQSK